MSIADDLDLMMSIPDSSFGEDLRREARGRVEAEITRLTEQLGEWHQQVLVGDAEIARLSNDYPVAIQRAEAAEAEVARLRGVLIALDAQDPRPPYVVTPIRTSLLDEKKS